ncbi:ROK family protein, partial [Acinetobacter baumannii]
PVKEGGPRILEEAIALARKVIESSTEPIEAIGMGAGGQIDATNGAVFSATDVLPGWKGLNIVGPVQTALGLPAKVDNDVNVLALG